MSKFKSKFFNSAKEIKKTSTIVTMALLISIKIVLGLLTISISDKLKISISFIPIAAIGVLFGPIAGAIAGFVGDIIGFVVNPGSGAFFFGYTITAVISGLTWGIVLYEERVSVKRILLCKIFINIVLNVALNSFWIYLTTGKAVIAYMPFRILKNILMLPIEVVLLCICIRFILDIFNYVFKDNLGKLR